MELKKKLNTTNTSSNGFLSAKEKVDSLLKGLKKEESALYLDACYVLSAISAGLKVSELVNYLSEKSTVIILKSVIDEVQNNLGKAEFSHVNRSAALADIKTLYSLSNMNSYVVFEDIEVSQEDIAQLSTKMKMLNPSGNYRVGLGEASIFKHYMAVKDLFKSVFIASNDADVQYIFKDLDVCVFGV